MGYKMLSKEHWITKDLFDHKLLEILIDMGMRQVLTIPGVYDACADHLKDTVFEALAIRYKQALLDFGD
jgi:hypothetical protein